MKNSILCRPLFMFCAVFFGCSILIANIPCLYKMVLILSTAILCIISALFRLVFQRRKSISNIAFLLLVPVLSASVLSFICFDKQISDLSEYSGVTDHVTVTIKDVRYSAPYYGYYTAKISGGAIVPDATVSIGFPDGSCSAGDILEGDVTVYTHKDSGTLESESALLSEGIFLSAEAEELKYIGRDNSSTLSDVFNKLNSTVSAKIRAASDNRSSLACAVLLGDRSYLSDAVSRDFTRLGISHLLAISGIHLSIIVGVMEFILGKTKIKRILKTSCLGGIILFYMALVGFSPSITRAGIMHLIRLAASLFDRENDSLTSLATAAAVIVLLNPSSAFDTALILSVTAAYACIVYAKSIKERPRVKGVLPKALRYSLDTAKLTLLISALTLPIIWSNFGEISILSPLTNIIFIPLITVYLYASLLYAVLCLTVGVPTLITEILCGFESLITSIAGKISHLHGITISLRQNGIIIFVILLFAAVLVSTVIYKNHKRLCRVAVSSALTCLIAFITASFFFSYQTYNLNFVSRGKSEGFVIRNGTSYVLIDMSDGSTGFLRRLYSTSNNIGATETDALVLTHLHQKHTSSVASLTDRMIVRQIFLPEPKNDDEVDISESIISLCYEKGISVHMYSRSYGERITLDGLNFEPYDYKLLTRSTHPIVSFNIKAGDKSYVYAGGSSSESSDDIKNDMLASDVVFFGIHPPIYKSLADFTVSGDGVFVSGADAEEHLSQIIIEGNTVVMPENGIHSTGSIPR